MFKLKSMLKSKLVLASLLTPAALLFLATPSHAAWHTEGVKSGVVTAGTVLADCGPVSGDGGRMPEVVLTTNILGVFALERRNTTNTTTIDEYIFVSNAGSFPWHANADGLPILDGERYRVILRTAIAAGTVWAAMGACE